MAGKVLSITTAGEATADNAVTFPSEYDNGSQGASWTADWNNGQKQRVTLTASTTSLTITAPTPAGSVGHFQLKVIQGGAGSFTITWPASVLWRNNGTAPTLTLTAGAVDIITFYWDGTNYYGAALLNFA